MKHFSRGQAVVFHGGSVFYEPGTRVPSLREYEQIVRRLRERSMRRPVLENVLPLTVASTGCRVSECLSLTTTDIDPDSCVLHIPTLKHGNVKRTVPIPSWLVAVLHRYIVLNSVPHRLFTVSRTHAWRIIKRATGYPPHSFRHAYGMYLLYRGVDPETVKRILGHSSWKLVSYYVSRVALALDKTVPLEHI